MQCTRKRPRLRWERREMHSEDSRLIFTFSHTLDDFGIIITSIIEHTPSFLFTIATALRQMKERSIWNDYETIQSRAFCFGEEEIPAMGVKRLAFVLFFLPLLLLRHTRGPTHHGQKLTFVRSHFLYIITLEVRDGLDWIGSGIGPCELLVGIDFGWDSDGNASFSFYYLPCFYTRFGGRGIWLLKKLFPGVAGGGGVGDIYQYCREFICMWVERSRCSPN